MLVRQRRTRCLLYLKRAIQLLRCTVLLLQSNVLLSLCWVISVRWGPVRDEVTAPHRKNGPRRLPSSWLFSPRLLEKGPVVNIGGPACQHPVSMEAQEQR